jgi:uncharacterized coiled-coil DUF342 family protein
VRQELARTTAERDAVEEANGRKFLMVQSLQRDVSQLQAERDAVKEANGSQFRMVQALQRDVSQLQAERDALSEQLTQAKEVADMFQQENAALQDTIRQLRAKQIHDDLPGILMVIQLAAEQARELI